jgi:hypothetical protein
MAYPTTLMSALLGGTLIGLIPASALAQVPLQVEPYGSDTIDEINPLDLKGSGNAERTGGAGTIDVPLTPPPRYRKQRTVVPQRRLPRSLHVDTVDVITR